MQKTSSDIPLVSVRIVVGRRVWRQCGSLAQALVGIRFLIFGAEAMRRVRLVEKFGDEILL